MLVSIDWLKKYVDINENSSELADLLTMLGHEAEDFIDAYDVANNSLCDLDWQEYGCSVKGKITEASHLPFRWDRECLPFGGDGETKIVDILKEK